jgi:CO/xanthine dehydrogenase FAD-binding subunit
MLRGRRVNEAVISKAADASLKGARPLCMNDYKIDLTKALVRRVLTAI